ncbi:MAG: hypothetical protein MI724_05185 [Spirochaetales bacterium]|nr:hypothetical protein [Spirochaetales bacterium]
MKIQELFAVVCVSHMARSVEWYAALIGREPDERPMDGLVQWRDLGGAGLQLVLDARRAGSGMITIVTPNMDNARRQLAAADIVLGPDMQGDYATLAQVGDPDGNTITLTEPPEGM